MYFFFQWCGVSRSGLPFAALLYLQNLWPQRVKYFFPSYQRSTTIIQWTEVLYFYLLIFILLFFILFWPLCSNPTTLIYFACWLAHLMYCVHCHINVVFWTNICMKDICIKVFQIQYSTHFNCSSRFNRLHRI